MAKKKNICPKASVIMMKNMPDVRRLSAPINSAANAAAIIATGQMISICVVPATSTGHVKIGV